LNGVFALHPSAVPDVLQVRFCRETTLNVVSVVVTEPEEFVAVMLIVVVLDVEGVVPVIVPVEVLNCKPSGNVPVNEYVTDKPVVITGVKLTVVLVG
jgi:hypothetical protein